VEGVTDDFVAAALADPQLGRFFGGPIQANLRARVVDLFVRAGGRALRLQRARHEAAHQGMGINESDWRIAVNLFSAALDRHRVAPREKAEFMRHHRTDEGPDRRIVTGGAHGAIGASWGLRRSARPRPAESDVRSDRIPRVNQ
jgi:truncated hemoglobin YjbI